MPKLLPITKYPDPILRKKSLAVATNDLKSNDFKNFCLDMVKTMVEKDGVGLAAPQVGKNIRVITINTKDGQVVMINPRITKKSWQKENGEEGCLSFPEIFGKVIRHKKVICTYTDTDGNKKTIEAKGLMARVLQHETDHLDGVLFIDKAKDICKNVVK